MSATWVETEDRKLAGLRFHALVYLMTTAKAIESPIPTRIYAFKRKSHYTRYGQPKTLGVFRPGLRSNTITLADYSTQAGASEVILHEYVHFVTNLGQSIQYPLWYSEGFAEFLSTVRTHEEMLVVGAFPKSRIWAFENLKWVALNRIISATDYGSISGRDGYMLYPESWALVHYLTLDRDNGRSLPNDFNLYVQLISEGLPPKDAFEEAFGEKIAAAGLKIRKMLDRGSMRVIGIPIDKVDYDRTPPVGRVPSTEEISVSLGQLALSVGNGERAEEDFAAAIRINPNNARAHAGIGDAYKFQERWEEAEPHFRRAVEIDGSDPLNHLDLAEFLHDSALKQESSEAMAELLTAARAAYAQSRVLDDAKPEVWVMEGRTYLAAGEDPRAGISMLKRGLEILPSSHLILESLAEAYIALDQDRIASEYLIRAYATRTEGSLEKGVLDQIEAIKERREKEAEKVSGSVRQ